MLLVVDTVSNEKGVPKDVLFGAVEALVPRVQATGADVPIYLMMMMPYLATLGVLVVASLDSRRRSEEPGNLGVPYIRQDRH